LGDESPGSAVLGFKNQAGCAYPRFLLRAWAAILNQDGSLRPINEIDVEAVACIRQISNLFYKLEMPYTSEQEDATVQAFLSAEDDVALIDLTSGAMEPLLNRAGKLVRRLLSQSDPRKILPKHGSGSSACGVKPHERYSSFRFIPRLNAEFPYDKYFFYNSTHICDNMDMLLDAEFDEPAAKVVFVPKDSRGPRLISEEPREFMYIQQGLMALMYDTVKHLPAVAGQIDFTDQTRNQEMAKSSSIDGKLATLDLKEASDRVSWKLVAKLFPEPWVRALSASRSQGTVLPDGRYVRLDKFAPMGSACCFPVEAICFWAIALAAMGIDDSYINRLFNNTLTEKDISISVFGDDIIVPTEFVPKVIRALESVGLIINRDKSFWEGFFRESCGGDYFNGHNVTPIRCKALPDNDARARHRTCELFNNLIRKYEYEHVGLALQLLFEEWYGPVPVSSRYRNSPDKEKTQRGLYLIGPYTDVPTAYKRRRCNNKQVTVYRIPCILSWDITIPADSWSHVLRKASKRLHLNPVTRAALPKRCRIKYRWTEL